MSAEAEATLLRAARSLDQNGAETVKSKLLHLWQALAATTLTTYTTHARFHAPEAVALRWLLKNMHAGAGAASPEVETLRRCPLTWKILGVIFGRIPLVSLAKSLADRRFVAVLQQTARDLATTPRPAASVASAVRRDAAPRPHKRKHDVDEFDLDTLREPPQRVSSVAAVFYALRELLARLDKDSTSLSSPYDQMGAEHIRSLFSVPASEALTLLAPLVKVIGLALDVFDDEDDDDGGGDDRMPCRQLQELEQSTERLVPAQASWVSTLSELWGLHAQAPTDSFEVAKYLSLDGLTLLGRLLRRPNTPSERCVDDYWRAALRRFFTNSLVLPARSAFLNRQDLQALAEATTNDIVYRNEDDAAYLAEAVFTLALDAPKLQAGAGLVAKDNETWLQTVFAAIQEPLMASKSVSASKKAATLSRLIEMAAQNDVSLSVDSLAKVCLQCAHPGAGAGAGAQDGDTNWDLLASTARCNANVFLQADEGRSLLSSVLGPLSRPPSSAQQTADHERASFFLAELAKGFASRGRLAELIMRWYDGMAALGTDVTHPDAAKSAWLARRLRSTVTKLLQTSLKDEHLPPLIDRIEGDAGSQPTAAQSVARLVVFRAITCGIQGEDPEAAAVQARMVDSVVAASLPSELSPDILAIKWYLIGQTLFKVCVPDAERIWAVVRPCLEHMTRSKKKLNLLREDTYAAFTCCYSFWMVLKPRGEVQQQAYALVLFFFGRFRKELAAITRDKDETAQLLQTVARYVDTRKDASEVVEGAFASKVGAVATYVAWMLCGTGQFFDEMLMNGGGEAPSILKTLHKWQMSLYDAAAASSSYSSALSAAGFENSAGAKSKRRTPDTADQLVERLEAAAVTKGPELADAIQALSRAFPLTASHRKRIVSILIPPRPTSGTASPPLTMATAGMVFDFLGSVMKNGSFGDLEFDRLVFLGETTERLAADAGSINAREDLVLSFLEVAKIAVGKSAAHPERCVVPASIPLALQAVLLEAKLATLRDHAENASETADVQDTKKRLAALLSAELARYVESAPAAHPLHLELRIAIHAVMAVDIHSSLAAQKTFVTLMEEMRARYDMLRDQVRQSWMPFVVRYSRGMACHPPRELQFGELRRDMRRRRPEDVDLENRLVPPDVRSDILEYLDNETVDYDAVALLSYIRELVGVLGRDTVHGARQLVAMEYLLGRLLDTPDVAAVTTEDGAFDLGRAQSELVQILPTVRSVAECRLLAGILHTLLVDDGRPRAAAAMGQWNIDATLSAAALLVRTTPGAPDACSAVHASTAAYDSACELVEAVLKRHRVRIEGRFHLLVATLQALLERLVTGYRDESKQGAPASKDSVWTPRAEQLSRLLGTICEPSTAAVALMTARMGVGSAKAGGLASLNSPKVAAKLSAGKHMYLFLMVYIKCADEANLSLDMTKALESGLFSILSITPDETRRVLNDAIDASGRVIFKDLYRKWLQFGKWKGV